MPYEEDRGGELEGRQTTFWTAAVDLIERGGRDTVGVKGEDVDGDGPFRRVARSMALLLSPPVEGSGRWREKNVSI